MTDRTARSEKLCDRPKQLHEVHALKKVEHDRCEDRSAILSQIEQPAPVRHNVVSNSEKELETHSCTQRRNITSNHSA